MDSHPIFRRYPDLKEVLQVFRREMQDRQRPASEVILTDQDVMALLKISKRKLDYIKSNREITYYQPKPNSSCYYFLADILKWIEKGRIEDIDSKLKL